MKTYPLLIIQLICCLLFPASAFSEAPAYLDEYIRLGLPVLDITTDNGRLPTCDFVDAPQGSWGHGITNAEKLPASLTIYNPDGSVAYQSGPYVKGESGITLKIRGNTSAYGTDKKPYKIKLQKKADLLSRGDKNLNDKNWVLQREFKMRYHLGFQVASIIQKEWTPAYSYVNVVINGDYRGLYQLVEGVERNEKCRINVAESGFVAESDAYWWNEDGQYVPSRFNPEYNYTFKYPDFEDMTPAQIQYISSALMDLDRAAADGSYSNLIDVESLARWIIGHDLLGTSDSGGANLYFTKYDDTDNSKFAMGPLWDFDSTVSTPDDWSNVHYNARIKAFWESDNALISKYVEIWKQEKEKISLALGNVAENLSSSDWDAFNASMAADNARWNKKDETANVYGTFISSWINKRIPWIDSRVKELDEFVASSVLSTGRDSYDISFSISGDSFVSLSGEADVCLYDLSGCMLLSCRTSSFTAPEMPGVYILSINGKPHKFMIP